MTNSKSSPESSVSPSIHPTAIIAPGAVIGHGCSVGPYSIIGPRIVLGKNNHIGPHVVLDGNTTFGDENTVFQFASIGAPPQDLKYHGESSTLTIGNKNIIREYVTIQPGTSGGGMKTTVGDGNLFMATTHVGHDTVVGNANIMANGAALAGHVWVGNYVTVGGLSGIHQFVRLGDHCFLGGGAMVVKDIPPFCIAQGDRAVLAGLNVVGLERRGLDANVIQQIKSLYRRIFLSPGTWKEKLAAAESEASGFKEGKFFLEFIGASTRGITLPRGRSRRAAEPEE